ncbi:MFS transporter [Pseudomonas citronellolis]|uniref:MFS transporter n=1 Tax=Pseudomonas citronellolis TaxID=53408 RepID=UPI0021BF5D0F|nr:MFS transporter [Pseudomonas citronellolis]UXJ50264.1 MFS transporter [Pseudomonas citronellolis]
MPSGGQTTSTLEQTTSRPPLSYPLFRAVWCAALTANICVWMQNVAAAWLMVKFDPAPLMVALVQTAITLPAFLFGLPAGVYADLIDRRRMLIFTHAWMLVATLVLYLLQLSSNLNPWSLLGLTFVLGAGSAVSIPAWQASTSDAVPRAALGAAINLNGIAYNAARAVGPALAGALIAAMGINWVFALNIILLLIVLLIFIFLYRPAAVPPPPPEPLFSAMRGGIRYVRHARQLHGQILRTLTFISCASGLWALLPLVAKNGVAGGYGLLLGSLGAGAVLGGLLLNRLRPRIRNYGHLATAANLIFVAGMLTAAWAPNLYLVSPSLVLGGAAWISFNSTTSASFQTALPAWVRARALAIFMLSFQGSMAVGGVIWGAVANHLGVSWTLTLAASLILLGLLTTRSYPLRMGNEAEVTPSAHWGELPVDHGLDETEGPVAVQIIYQVASEHRDAFCRDIYSLGKTRRRDGASHWLLYRDLSNPDHFSERFIVASWGEYLRQRERSTLADRKQEDNLRRFLQPGTTPAISHFLVVAPIASTP